MRFCTLLSGSSGNAVYIQEGETRLLVDIGMSFRELNRRLERLSVSVHQLSGLLLTHEHIDHTKGLQQFALRTDVPIYGARQTLLALMYKLPGLSDGRFTAFSGHGPFEMSDLLVSPFEVPHDVPCLGYRLEGATGRLGLVTDLGHLSPSVLQGLRDVDFALIEANHDPELLRCGPYPAVLKRRILSPQGHLSNQDCGLLACGLLQRGCRHFLLGHLSNTNNLPSLALESVCGALLGQGVRPGEVTVDVAPRSEPSPLFEFCQAALQEPVAL